MPGPDLPPITEADVLEGVTKAFAMFGITLERQNTGALKDDRGRLVRFGTAGNPDLTGTLPDGRRLDVEIKRPGKRPEPHQVARMQELNARGGVALWLDNAADVPRNVHRLNAGWRIETEWDGTQWLVSP